MKVADLTPEELRTLVRESVAEALEELLGDPDEGLELKEEVKERLRRSLDQAEPSLAAEEVAKRLGLSW
jgi:hypothetical protein